MLISLSSYEACSMSEKSKLRIENPVTLAFSLFYLISGILFLYSLTNDPNMVHIALIGILSVITAFGVFRMERWSIWLVFVLFCMGNAFSFSLIFQMSSLLFEITIIAYLILIWIATIYLMAKREIFH